MKQNDQRSALNPPEHIVDTWFDWLKKGGYSGSLEEMEQAYLESKGYDNWPDYLLDIGIDGHFNQQRSQFWAHFSKTFPALATLKQRLVHYRATTSFGAWYIQKYLGVKGRIAA